MANLQKYTDYSPEAFAEDDKLIESFSQKEFWKPEDERNVIRMLPPTAGRRSPVKVTNQHYVEIPGLERAVSFTCPVSEGRACPLCKTAIELGRSPNPKDQDRAYEMSAKPRVYANIIDRAAEDRGVRVYAFGKAVWKNLKLVHEECPGFTHPLEGFDLTIAKEGEGKKTKYDVNAKRQPSRLAKTDQQIDLWLEARFDLDKYGVPPTQDQLEAMMRGEGRAAGGKAPAKAQRARQQGEVIDAAVDDSDDLSF